MICRGPCETVLLFGFDVFMLHPDVAGAQNKKRLNIVAYWLTRLHIVWHVAQMQESEAVKRGILYCNKSFTGLNYFNNQLASLLEQACLYSNLNLLILWNSCHKRNYTHRIHYVTQQRGQLLSHRRVCSACTMHENFTMVQQANIFKGKALHNQYVPYTHFVTHPHTHTLPLITKPIFCSHGKPLRACGKFNWWTG